MSFFTSVRMSISAFFYGLQLFRSFVPHALLLCTVFWGAINPEALLSLASPAELKAKDVNRLMNEMMSMHPVYRDLSPELMQRLLFNFALELDPLKIYYTDVELAGFLHPSYQTVQRVMGDLKQGRFDYFSALLSTMPQKVERMHAIQKSIKDEKTAAIRGQQAKGYEEHIGKELAKYDDWPSDEEALYKRVREVELAQDQAILRFPDMQQRERAYRTLEKLQSQYERHMCPNPASEMFENTLMTLVMKAFAQSLDSQSAFFSPNEAKNFLIAIQQRLFGIGVVLRDDFDGLTITKLVEGGPAERSREIQVDDKIIAVHGEPVIGLSNDEAVDMIRGKEGTPVHLTIVRKDENGEVISKEVTLIRSEIVVSEERYSSSLKEYKDGVMVCLRLNSFYQDDRASAYDDLERHINELHSKHVIKGIILDLRNNPGGLITQAVAVSGLFLDRGVVVSVKDDRNVVYHLRNIESKKVWDGPLVVLVNRASASASEIVAQTLQDWGRAIVVGDDRTYGKGSFQWMTLNTDKASIPNIKGEYKITRGRYYTVSGKSPQLIGVVPDIVVPGPLQFLDIGERFLKFPLSEDAISESFHDRFEDLPFYQRPFAGSIYNSGRQERLSSWNRYLPFLRELSQERQSSNTEYQEMLQSWEANNANKEGSAKASDEEEPVDFQMNEAWNILRDLIKIDMNQNFAAQDTGRRAS